MWGRLEQRSRLRRKSVVMTMSKQLAGTYRLDGTVALVVNLDVCR